MNPGRPVARPRPNGEATRIGVVRAAGVGAVRSSGDGGDSTTLHEPRDRASTTRLRQTKAGQVLNKDALQVIKHPTWVLGRVWEVAHAQ